MRAQSDIEQRILGLIAPEARALDLDIVRVRVTGSKRPVLQIMAERADGSMDVEDCAKLSRRLSLLLDEQDPIAGEYTLEVSSPGIDRPLTRPGDFARWTGHEARVEIAAPVDGRRRFHGSIVGEQDGRVALDLKDGGRAEIPLTEMTKARLVLTDALIETARARGHVPAETEDGFDEVEVENEDPPEEMRLRRAEDDGDV
mgnify:CR=1 FL=1